MGYHRAPRGTSPTRATAIEAAVDGGCTVEMATTGSLLEGRTLARTRDLGVYLLLGDDERGYTWEADR
jgi:hypothetical protein